MRTQRSRRKRNIRRRRWIIRLLWYGMILIFIYSVIHWGYDRRFLPEPLQSAAGSLIGTVDHANEKLRGSALGAAGRILRALEKQGIPVPEGLSWITETTPESTASHNGGPQESASGSGTIQTGSSQENALQLSPVYLPADLDGYLLMDCIDVGQADATLIRQGEHAMLFDCGGEVPMVLRSYLQSQQIELLDSVWLSHPDRDHIESFPSVAYGCRIGMDYSNGEENQTVFWQRVEETRRYDSLQLKVPAAGFRIPLGDAVLEVLGPETLEGDIPNNHSLAVQITYGDTSFLLCGDAQAEEEQQLADRWGEKLRSDVLHVSHHGSSTSTTSAFLDMVRPDWAVISCGKNNEFGHPHKSVLSRLENVGAGILRTDESGTIRILSDGSHLTVGGLPPAA